MHTGRSVGLHWHLLRHMKQTGAITQATYKGLRKAIEDAASVSKVTKIKAALRSAYDDYFRGCTSAVRAWLRKTLDPILPVGGA